MKRDIWSPFGAVRLVALLVAVVFVATLDQSAAAQRAHVRKNMIEPDFKDVSYGPHERNKLDIYLAKSDEPTPFVIFIHGGGFRKGDKVEFLRQAQLRRCLDAGISYVAVNYRLTDTAIYPAQMHDCARALQFVRANADKWNLDPTRVAATGGSAGAGISQWLAFHDDLADPSSSDPVARQSTRVTCAMPFNAQCTYDPRLIKQIVPGDAYNHNAMKWLFGVDLDFDWNNDPIPPEVEARIQDCGPLTHLTPDDPPIMILNHAVHEVEGNIHHPNFGRHLKKVMDEMGVPCIQRLDTDYPDGNEGAFAESVRFFQQHFGMLDDAEASAATAPR